MNQKVNELVEKGANVNLAIALSWTSLTSKEKNHLSLDQCLAVWDYASIKSPEGFEAWTLLKLKAETLEDWKHILENILLEEVEGAIDILNLAIKKAKSDEDFYYLLEMIPPNTPKFFKSLITLAEEKALTFDQIVAISDKISDHTPEKEEIWALAKTKAKILAEWHWVWEFMPELSLEESEVCSELKTRIKSFKDCQWILGNTPEESPLKIKVWNLVKERVAEF